MRFDRERPGIDPTGWTREGMKEKADTRTNIHLFKKKTVFPLLLKSFVNGAVVTLLHNLTERASFFLFFLAKLVRHKWESDYSTNHSSSSTVITTPRATLARRRLTSFFFWRGAPLAAPPPWKHASLRCSLATMWNPQHLFWHIHSQWVFNHPESLQKTSCCHVSLMVTIKYRRITP